VVKAMPTDTPTKLWLMHLQLALVWISGFGTHGNGNQHGYEQDFILVPECVCSEDKKAWMNEIRNIHILERKDIHSAQTADIIPRPVIGK
jgi:hypothetical protein